MKENKLNMKKLLCLLAVLVTAVTATVTAADFATVGLDAGYNNYYTVNGVARAENTSYVGFNAIKDVKYADVYVGGTLLPSDNINQSHWVAGLGRSLDLNKTFSLRLTADVTRHQSGDVGIVSSTEAGVKLALNNPYVTPYVRGSFDVDLHQNGFAVGLQRVQKLPYGFTITPAAEYGNFTDYNYWSAKATLARPVGFVTPYAEVGWVNDSFGASKYKFATREFNDAVVVAAGLKLTF